MNCDRCDKVFSNKYTLATHLKNSKTCGGETSFVCELCSKSLSSKNRLKIHTATCKANTDRKEITNTIIEEYKARIESLEKQLKEKTEQLDAILEHKKSLKPLDLDPEIIKEKFITKIDDEHIKQGQKGIAQFIVSNILTDSSGNILYKCTDKHRQKFVYYDMNGVKRTDYRLETIIEYMNLSGIFKLMYHHAKNLYSDIEDLDELTNMSNLILDLVNIKNPEFNQDFRRSIIILVS